MRSHTDVRKEGLALNLRYNSSKDVVAGVKIQTQSPPPEADWEVWLVASENISPLL